MRLLVSALAVVLWLAVPVPVLLAAPASAAGTIPSALTVSAPAAPAGATTPVTVLLTSQGAPVAGAVVTVERRVGGAWSALGSPVTDGSGQAQVPLVLATEPGDDVVRASWAGDDARAAATAETAVALVRQASALVLGAPRGVVEGQQAAVTVGWTAADGRPVTGPVVLERLVGRGAAARWVGLAHLVTGTAGQATTSVGLDDDTRLRARGAATAWVEASTSAVRSLRLLPAGDPVRLPRAAPRPRVRVPAQPRAVGPGADPVVTTIPDAVWSSMVGRSWHAGCPVGRSGLRLLRISYWDYDGFRRRGELVAAAGAVQQMAAALTDLYDARLPVRSMYRVDRFGWSSRLRGADDLRSMAAGNTSAFNCRDVVNRPGVRSPHSSGRSLDLNPWENPYRSARGLVPDRWWQARSDPRVAWRSRAHAVVRIMARHGLRWTYGLGDTQHFDAR